MTNKSNLRIMSIRVEVRDENDKPFTHVDIPYQSLDANNNPPARIVVNDVPALYEDGHYKMQAYIMHSKLNNLYVAFFEDGTWQVTTADNMQDALANVTDLTKPKLVHITRYYENVDKTINDMIAKFASKTGWQLKDKDAQRG